MTDSKGHTVNYVTLASCGEAPVCINTKVTQLGWLCFSGFFWINPFQLGPLGTRTTATIRLMFFSCVLKKQSSGKLHCTFFSLEKLALLCSLKEVNPLSPSIHIRILQTDLHTFPWRNNWENLFKFLLGDHFIDSHNLSLYSVWIIVRRKLILDTIET